MKHILLIIFIAIPLVACSKDETQSVNSNKKGGPGEKMEAGYYMADAALKRKEIKGGFLVSAIDLKPVFKVPVKYQSYNRIELTEMDEKELNAQGSDNRDYQVNWLKQASSVEKPDWWSIAATKNSALRSTTNDFKKQEEAEKEKSVAKIDKKDANVIVTMRSDFLTFSKPNIADEEYYIVLPAGGSMQGVTSDYKNVYYSYSYSFNMENLGISRDKCQGDPCGNYQITVKVPKLEAKRIEEARESGKDIFRFYGHAQNLSHWDVKPTSLQGNIVVDVEALEIGSRQNGVFIPYLFIDTDQFNLMKWKKVKTRVVLPGM